jgi:hypothetical protein
MKNWIKAMLCKFKGHNVVRGNACPVTGIVKLTCNNCGATNVPKHQGATFS